MLMMILLAERERERRKRKVIRRKTAIGWARVNTLPPYSYQGTLIKAPLSLSLSQETTFSINYLREREKEG